jgi:hypothetical protein
METQQTPSSPREELLKSREPLTRTPDLKFECKKIAFDKLLLLFLALAAVGLNRYLEDYKSRQSWQHDISNQRMSVAKDISEASSTLERRHSHLVEVMQRGLPTTEPEVQTAIHERSEAGDRLSSKSEFTRALLPDGIVVPFERLNEAVFSLPLQGAPAIDGMSQISALQQDAQDRLREYVRGLADGERSPTVLPPCTPPRATTEGTEAVHTVTASFRGVLSGKASQTWFDFDETPALTFSVPAVDGRGFAQGLKPGHTYYYRFVARNACGRSGGAVRQFTTPTEDVRIQP